ncbi:MAG: hypothetical protein ABI700_25560 [Chloroflexota bacterium]
MQAFSSQQMRLHLPKTQELIEPTSLGKSVAAEKRRFLIPATLFVRSITKFIKSEEITLVINEH